MLVLLESGVSPNFDCHRGAPGCVQRSTCVPHTQLAAHACRIGITACVRCRPRPQRSAAIASGRRLLGGRKAAGIPPREATLSLHRCALTLDLGGWTRPGGSLHAERVSSQLEASWDEEGLLLCGGMRPPRHCAAPRNLTSALTIGAIVDAPT